jgi:HAD superfamily hydrolase (TIGR01509 family)
MDALIFDFDGVVVDSEPIHLKCFREVLGPVGVRLTSKDYYGKYLGYDDHDCFAAVAADKGLSLGESRIAEMIAAKTALVRQAFAEAIRPLPGAVELIRSAAEAGIPVTVCSGALRDEIELAAKMVGALRHFRLIISAEDVSRGKPDPQGYRLTLRRLTTACGRRVAAGRCVAVEDSPAGIEAAAGTGMRVLAVTNSYPRSRLCQADRVVNSLSEVTIEQLEELCR